MSDSDDMDKVVAAILTAGMLAKEDADTAKYLHVYERFIEAITKRKEEKAEESEVGTLFTDKPVATPKRKLAATPQRKRR
jgi:hypothetical protein